MVLRLPNSWPNWNLEMLVFEERGKLEYPEKNLSEQGREPTANSNHIWSRSRELNPSALTTAPSFAPRETKLPFFILGTVILEYFTFPPLSSPSKLAPATQAKCFREYCTFPRAFDNNNLHKIWGSNRV